MNSYAPNRINLSLFLFVLTSIGYVFGSLIESTPIELTSTILLIPSLTFFYFSRSKRELAYELILIFSWVGSMLIFSKTFLYSIAGVMSFWGVILLLADHIIKKLKNPLAQQFKKKRTLFTFFMHTTYLVGILYMFAEPLGSFIYPISCYGISLVGTSFLSTVLWNENKSKTNLYLMIGIIMLVISGSILAIKLFTGQSTLLQDFFRLSFYVGSELFICLYYIGVKKSK